MDDFLWRTTMGLGASRPSAQVKITGADGSKRAVRDALANLEEQSPEDAAWLREQTGAGRSTDPKWDD